MQKATCLNRCNRSVSLIQTSFHHIIGIHLSLTCVHRGNIGDLSIISVSDPGPDRLIGDGEADLNVRRIDEGGIDGDLCAVISSPSLAVVCLVWPTAGKLKSLKSLADVRQ